MLQQVLAELQDVIDPVIEDMVERKEILPDHPDSPTPPLSEQQKRDQLRQQLREYVYDDERSHLMLRAIAVIEQHLASTSDPERCGRELAGITAAAEMLSTTMLTTVFGQQAQPDEIKSQLRDALINSSATEQPTPPDSGEVDTELLEDLPPMHEALGVSRETFDDLYALARRLFEQRHVDDAAALFHFLTYLDGTCHEVWFSLGACRQTQAKPRAAIAAYMAALQLDAGNPNLYRNLANCYLALADRASAEDVVQLANACLPQFELTEQQRRDWETAAAEIQSRLK